MVISSGEDGGNTVIQFQALARLRSKDIVCVVYTHALYYYVTIVIDILISYIIYKIVESTRSYSDMNNVKFKNIFV